MFLNFLYLCAQQKCWENLLGDLSKMLLLIAGDR